MTMKRLIALLLSLLLLISLFAGCAATNESKTDDSGTKQDKSASSDEISDEDAGSDAPKELELRPLTYMGSTSGAIPDMTRTAVTIEEARDGNYVTYQAMCELLLDYGLDYKFNLVLSDAYKTVLAGAIASGTEDDLYNSREILDDSTINQLVANGKVASIDDILEYSTGLAKTAYNDPDQCLYLKAFATVEDGNWYYVPLPNTSGSDFDYSNSKYNLRATGQIGGAYSVNVRKDWLEKVGLAIPTTPDEFFEMLVAFQENDVNDSQTKDERYYSLLGSDFQTNGIGQWFGLPYTDFIEDPATGVIEVLCLTDGYKEFCDYEGKLYANNLIYIEGSHPWDFGTTMGANVLGAIGMMTSNVQFTNTGDENSQFVPMPIVQALEDVEPRLLVQESQAAFVGFCFRKDCDYQAAAALLDMLLSQEFFMLWWYGIEGVAWDWLDDGTIETYDLSADIMKAKNYGGCTGWCNQNMLPVCGGHHGNIWGVPQRHFDDPLAVLETDSVQYKGPKHDAWCESHKVPLDTINGAAQMMLYISEQGKDFYHPAAYYSYTTMMTDDEAAFADQISSDLTTYLREMTTNMIVGSVSTDTIDEQVEFAFDNLYLQEYIDIMQARVNRYLKAIGREPVPIESRRK